VEDRTSNEAEGALKRLIDISGDNQMKRLLMFLAVMLLAAIPASAQSDYPSAEIFGGYSYLSADTGAVEDEDIEDFFDNREGVHGVGFSVAANLSRNFGVVGDFSYHWRNLDQFGIGDIKLSTLFFLFGPRVYARSDRVTGFAHALVGGVRAKADFNFPGFSASESQTDFAMGFGGGVDVNITSGLAVRLFQADYIPVRSDGRWLHNLRAQVGLTLKLGQ
jgi:opacity protein-like surface antigen